MHYFEIPYYLMRRRGSKKTDNIPEDESSLLGDMSLERPSSYYAVNIRIGYQELINTPGVKYGRCYKRNNAVLAPIFSCCYKKWKIRCIVTAGNYIYRFSDENATSTKGVPIPLDSASIKVDRSDPDCILEVSTIRKSYLFKFESREELEDWFVFLKERKSKAIQERMGHLPISKEIAGFNKKSDALFNRVLYKEAEDADNQTNNPMLNSVF